MRTKRVLRTVLVFGFAALIAWGAIREWAPGRSIVGVPSARARTAGDGSNARPSVFAFLSGRLLEVSKYCGGKADSEAEKWLHDKFICDVHATDVVTAMFTVVLAVLTGILGWIAALQIFTTRRQLRAYVFPDSTVLVEGMMLEPKQPERANVPGIALAFKNRGQTPAYKVVSWAQIAVIEVSAEATLRVPALQMASVNSIGADGGISKALWFERALTGAEIEAIGQSVRGIYVYGRVEYDTFGKRKHSNFRLRYTGRFPPIGNPVFNFCDEGNDAN